MIKFRGKVDGLWWYVVPEDHATWEEFWGHVDKKTISQYAGYKDKNGKEIYGGDIVFSDYANKAQRRVVEWGIVGNEWGICACGFIFNDQPDDVEVIGNIYDNRWLARQVKREMKKRDE